MKTVTGGDAMRTIEEIERSEKEMLSLADIAPVIGCDQHSIRLQARADARALGFPVIVIGTRTYVPRDGFVNFCRGRGAEVTP